MAGYPIEAVCGGADPSGAIFSGRRRRKPGHSPRGRMTAPAAKAAYFSSTHLRIECAPRVFGDAIDANFANVVETF
jgi:hypothetical protein